MHRLASLMLILLLLVLVPLTAHATTPTAPSDPMARLAGLIGEWRGSGWMLQPDGTRSTFESREIVTPRLSGAALLVEGKHWPPGEPDRLVHDAMAMITWDAGAGAYRFRSALANGTGGDFPLQVGESSFTWRLELPSGHIDYTAEFGGDTWHETGRYMPTEGQPIDIFEMTLARQR